jgi:hypothetical protein
MIALQNLKISFVLLKIDWLIKSLAFMKILQARDEYDLEKQYNQEREINLNSTENYNTMLVVTTPIFRIFKLKLNVFIKCTVCLPFPTHLFYFVYCL